MLKLIIWQATRKIAKSIHIEGHNIARYESDVADPASVYKDPARRALCLKMYGNICFDTRESYVNFPWSSERR